MIDLKPASRLRRLALLVFCLSCPAWASAAEQAMPLPSAGFEEVKPTPAGGALQAVEAGGVSLGPSTPAGWSAYQWGPNQKRYALAVEPNTGRSGAALRARNLDPEARAGVYTHLPLQPGTYRLSVWARAAAGQTSTACIYLGNRYSRPFALTDQWKQISLTSVISEAMARAELNIQNCSGQSDDVWFDDAELVFLGPVALSIVPDTRPERPRTLLFSPINVNYLRETAADWAKRGFRGFLFDGIMHEPASDVWSVDGDAKTRGQDDALFREVKACNDACRVQGIDSNFIKVAFYTLLPDPFDDQAWSRLSENFAQAALFAKQSGCAGIAIDTEYVSSQYNPRWPGYAESKHTQAEIARAYRERLRTITRRMLEQYPTMVLLTLPEGIKLYRDYYRSIFEGMLEACAQADAPGGLHLLTEETYHLTSPIGLGNYAEDLNSLILERVDPTLHDYWKRRCTLALGAWPLGYYRPLFDESGKQIGYGGRKETFGDKVVGSYADRSAWYPPETFRQQMAGLNTFSPRYNWVYAHGGTFWSLTPEQMAQLKTRAHKPKGDSLPTVTNLNDYFDAIAHPGLVKLDGASATMPAEPASPRSAR